MPGQPSVACSSKAGRLYREVKSAASPVGAKGGVGLDRRS